jgi:hypothetical protein
MIWKLPNKYMLEINIIKKLGVKIMSFLLYKFIDKVINRRINIVAVAKVAVAKLKIAIIKSQE